MSAGWFFRCIINSLQLNKLVEKTRKFLVRVHRIVIGFRARFDAIHEDDRGKSARSFPLLITLNRRLDTLSNDTVALFKQIMGSYPTGVTIVTTTDSQANPWGLTVNSFASVSLDPLLVLWCIDRRASSLEAFKKSAHYAVHVLAADQKDLCWAFAGKEPDRFSKANWSLSENQLPILSDSLGVFECKKVQEVDAGDHVILIGEVIGIQKQDKEPMLYFRRNVGAIPADWPA